MKTEKQLRREAKLQERKQVREQAVEEDLKKAGQAHLVRNLFMVAGVLVVGWLVYSVASNYSGPQTVGGISFPTGNVHWHADLRFNVCGERFGLPKPLPGQHLGSPVFHTHEDGRVHIEGSVNAPDEITVERFLSNVGVPLTETSLRDKQNGDSCPSGNPGLLSMKVNGRAVSPIASHVIREGDDILLEFA